MTSQFELPEHLRDIRPHQVAAREEIAEMFDSGKDIVVVDAPTGTGKSLLSELARRDEAEKLGDGIHKTVYLCGTKGLQDQYAADFTYGNVIKGRKNYPTEFGEGMVTADDCMGKACMYCESQGTCPYTTAKKRAVRGELAIANYAYMLGEANSAQGQMGGRHFAIGDECDLIEGELMRNAEFYVSGRRLDGLGVTAPKKGARKPTLVNWFDEEFLPYVAKRAKRLNPRDLREGREQRGLMKLMEEGARVKRELEKDILQKIEGETDGMWIRDYPRDGSALSLKPVIVKRYGITKLFKHAEKWLLMSASVISADEMLDSLGASGLDYGVVTVPMAFPVENRPIHITPMGAMNFKEQAGTIPAMITAIEKIVEMNVGKRVLIHTHTYKLAEEFSKRCSLPGRPVFVYGSSMERDDVFRRYAAAEGSVMFAPSMDRGYDFAGDLARVVIICKVPFPYLGDAQTSARMHMEGGQSWYTCQTVRTIVQMTGRGVRSAEDTCESFILDKDFLKVWRQDRSLFPRWWQEAVNMRYDVRGLM